jgi:histidinol-phosphate aminotransferase
VFEPTYALHSHIARITGTEVATGERHDDFTIDLDEVKRVLGEVNPSVTFLCSPNNPTGTVDPPDVLAAVLEWAPGLVVVDEAYGQFAPRSAVDDAGPGRPLVVVRTFSKTWSMAAARLGYCVAPPEVVDALDKVVLPYHLDAVKQAAGELALDFEAEMKARVAAMVEERGRIVAAMSQLDVDVFPSGANFVLFRPRHIDGRAVWQGLLDRSVLVRDCSSWPRLDGCLRVTIGTPAEDDAFLAALAEVLDA